MNREDLERAGGPLAASLSNAFRRKKVGKALAAQIASGLNLPDENVYREFGLLPEKQEADDEDALILTGLLNEIADPQERKETLSLVSAIIRHVARRGKNDEGAMAGKRSEKGRRAAARN